MKNIHHATAVLLCAISLMLHPAGVLADESIKVYDPEKNGSIKIAVVDSQTGAPIKHDADVELYKTAEADNSAGYLNFRLIKEFAETGLSLADMTPEKEIAAVNAFLSVISEKHIKADATDSPKNNEVYFTDLKQGVYLVVYKSKGKVDGGTLVIDPFLLSVPMQNVEGTGWLYNVVSYPKFIIRPDPTPTVTAVPPVPTFTPAPLRPYIPYVPPASGSTPTNTPVPTGVPLITGTPVPPPLYNVTQPPYYAPGPIITKAPDPVIVMEPSPPPFGAPKLPQTGLNRLPVLIMSVLGSAFIILGFIDSLGKRGIKK